jgi:hypothetical protein
MKKKTRLFRKLVMLAIAGLLATQVAPASMASKYKQGSQNQKIQEFKVDLSSETQILDEYLRSLDAFLKRVATLKADLTVFPQSTEQSVSKPQIATAKADAENLKRRAAEVARNIQSLIRKLKSTDLWNRLNAIVEARLKDSAAFGIIARNGGPSEWLEHAASVYTASASEFFDKVIADIKSKHQARSNSSFSRARSSGFNLMTVGYHPAVSKVGVSFVCLTHGVRAISKSLKGSSTRIEVEEFKQDCGDK